MFWSLLYSLGLHLLDQKYNNNVKYYYNLKELFSMRTYVNLFLWSKLNVQHHSSSLQRHMIFRNHSICWFSAQETCLVNVVTCHSLQGLVEADGGGAVEDDVDTGSECLYILWTDGQAGLRELAADGDDLLMKVRIIFTHAVEHLRNTHRRSRQRCTITRTTHNTYSSSSHMTFHSFKTEINWNIRKPNENQHQEQTLQK